MVGKPRILSLFLNSSKTTKSNSEEKWTDKNHNHRSPPTHGTKRLGGLAKPIITHISKNKLSKITIMMAALCSYETIAKLALEKEPAQNVA